MILAEVRSTRPSTIPDFPLVTRDEAHNGPSTGGEGRGGGARTKVVFSSRRPSLMCLVYDSFFSPSVFNSAIKMLASPGQPRGRCPRVITRAFNKKWAGAAANPLYTGLLYWTGLHNLGGRLVEKWLNIEIQGSIRRIPCCPVGVRVTP